MGPEADESTTSFDLTNDVSSRDPTREINQKTPESMKQSWKNPEYRKMRAEAIKQSWEKEENKKKKDIRS